MICGAHQLKTDSKWLESIFDGFCCWNALVYVTTKRTNIPLNPRWCGESERNGKRRAATGRKVLTSNPTCLLRYLSIWSSRVTFNRVKNARRSASDWSTLTVLLRSVAEQSFEYLTFAILRGEHGEAALISTKATIDHLWNSFDWIDRFLVGRMQW